MGAAAMKRNNAQYIEDDDTYFKHSSEALNASKSVQTRAWRFKAALTAHTSRTIVSNSGPAITEVQLPGSLPGGSSISNSPILQGCHNWKCPQCDEANEGTVSECHNCVVKRAVASGLSSSGLNLVGPSTAVNSAERAIAEEAALSAIRTTLNSAGQAPTDNEPTKAPTNCFRTLEMVQDPFRILELEPSITTDSKEIETRWPAEIGIESRKVMLYWLKHARRTKKEDELCLMKETGQARKATTERRNASASRKTKASRVGCLVQMYVEREEELARHCLQDPDHVLTAQMDSLTHCANSLSGWNLPSLEFLPKGGKRRSRSSRSIGIGGTSRRRRRKPGIDGADGFSACGRAWSGALRRSDSHLGAEESDTHEDFGVQISASEALDEAMWKHGKWKMSRDSVHKQITSTAASYWQDEQAAFSTATVPVKNAKLVAELRAERERLAALLPLFETSVRQQQRKQQREWEQENVDIFESMQEARLAADWESLEYLRARRRTAEGHGALERGHPEACR